jgi:hypothetical protein
MNMYPTVYLMMYGILLFAIQMFGKYPARIAVIIVMVSGWILLPQAHLSGLPHIPYNTKIEAISLSILLAVAVKDPKIFGTLKLSWVDIPIICWSIAPFFSSLTNDLGPYDGLNVLESQTIQFGVPYFLGRVYFGNYTALKELAMGLVLGAIIQLPLVVVELVMSPQMHTWVYGWYPHDFMQAARDGGYRPSVFMSHGLELAIWNSAALFMGWQLYLKKVIPNTIPFLKIPTMPTLIIFTLVFIRCKSSGALALFFLAMLLMTLASLAKSKLPLILVLILPFLYMNVRGTGAWDGKSLVDLSTAISGAGRASSLAFRMYNENLLVQKAQERIIFGWGEYGRSFVYDSDGRPLSVPDGRWIIYLGTTGVFGLLSFCGFMLIPAFLFFQKCPYAKLATPEVVSASCFAIFLGITMIDNLFNAMNNPVLIVAAGGLSSLVLSGNILVFSGDKKELEESPLVPQYTTRTI